MSIEMASGKGRIWVIDVARFYAMALVFYGHFIERFMLLKNPAGFAQYKFILDTLGGSGLTVFWVGCLMTFASLGVCIPLIYIFNKFVPQIVGKPKLSGPWLKNFI